MSQGMWSDFTDKYGFHDGASLEGRDYRARDLLCELLNEHPAVKAAGIRAVPFDRPGLHNGCLLILLKDEPGVSDTEMLAHWSGDKSTVMGLPELEVGELEELIGTAYNLADEE